MISDEKRHEVSLLLREEFGQGQCQWSDLFRDMLAEILECGGTLDGAPLYDQMAEKLADLIDRPTCEMKSIPKSSYRVCSRCGAFVRRDAVTNCTEAIPVRFCPNCDARVVRGDE